MNKQKGFTLVEGLLIAIVVGIIGFGGYYVFKNQNDTSTNDTNPTTNNQEIKYVESTDSTNTFNYEYPDTWTINPYVWEDCCEGLPKTEPDWSKESIPITLHPIEDENVVVTIISEKYGINWDSYDTLVNSVKEDYFATILFDGIREDGHKALFSRVDYLGPPDAKVESFTDHRYYFDDGENIVKIEFREKYHHDWPDDETGPDINNTQYLSDFENIAKSLKFTD